MTHKDTLCKLFHRIETMTVLSCKTTAAMQHCRMRSRACKTAVVAVRNTLSNPHETTPHSWHRKHQHQRMYVTATPDRPQRDYTQFLQDLPPSVTVITNPYELHRHGQGESYWPSVPPDLVVLPQPSSSDSDNGDNDSLEDVRAIVRACIVHRIPLIPFGTGTSLEGHTAALQGGICLDTSPLQHMQLPTLNDDTIPEMTATVGAGVTRLTLNTALRATGLQFSVDPGADASLGGMVATGASGTSAVKYGMRDNLRALTCVVADETATVVHAGTRARKNSAGYALPSLLCGSEGTLGVITSVTVQLHPIPEHVVAVVGSFATVRQAAQAVATLQTRAGLARAELLDAASVAAFCATQSQQQQSMSLEHRPTLFLELEGATEVSLHEALSCVQHVCVDECNSSPLQYAWSTAERAQLWKARHSLYYAAIASRPGATTALVTDACVPLPHLAHMVDATVQDVHDSHVVGLCFGHAGDGNVHCILPLQAWNVEASDYLQRVQGVSERLVHRALAVGGTCTGEHGVGQGKMRYLEQQYGPGAVLMMQRIKDSLDPYGIMNPGKIVPYRGVV
jgi:D-lactate dehydrogenase (cytochrome)